MLTENLKLEDFKIGSYVILWCEGIGRWDSDVVKIVSQGILTGVEYRSGIIREFYSSARCKAALF